MSVYVDKPTHKYGRMITCHMIADTIEELHEMADLIEVRRKWFQGNASFPHYDICKAKRSHAVKIGAIESLSRLSGNCGLEVMNKWLTKTSKQNESFSWGDYRDKAWISFS